MDARCQCGSVSFKTPLPEPLALYICHCSECRRQTGSAFGASAIFPHFKLPETDYLNCYAYVPFAFCPRSNVVVDWKKWRPELMLMCIGSMQQAADGVRGDTLLVRYEFEMNACKFSTDNVSAVISAATAEQDSFT